MKCEVCGIDFETNLQNHYIAIEGAKPGFFQGDAIMYDAFDCPHCGCQHITNERKRAYLPLLTKESTDDKEET